MLANRRHAPLTGACKPCGMAALEDLCTGVGSLGYTWRTVMCQRGHCRAHGTVAGSPGPQDLSFHVLQSNICPRVSGPLNRAKGTGEQNLRAPTCLPFTSFTRYESGQAKTPSSCLSLCIADSITGLCGCGSQTSKQDIALQAWWL